MANKTVISINMNKLKFLFGTILDFLYIFLNIQKRQLLIFPYDPILNWFLWWQSYCICWELHKEYSSHTLILIGSVHSDK